MQPAKSQLIDGPEGSLEILFEVPDFVSEPVSIRVQEPSPIVVICHPHSQHGGSMTNKVVHMLAKTAHKLGLRTVRFNFRGVGQSAGSFDEGTGEVADCLAVMDWARAQSSNQTKKPPIWLAGFSFGSLVAFNTLAALSDQADVDNLLLVAPPVRMFEFAVNSQINVPWLILQGREDEITDFNAVERWVASLPLPPEFHLLDGVDHFFNGKLSLLANVVEPFWQQHLGQ